jgi:hypothetical protein
MQSALTVFSFLYPEPDQSSPTPPILFLSGFPNQKLSISPPPPTQSPHAPLCHCCVLTTRMFSDQYKSSNSIEEEIRNRITVENKAYHANQFLFKSRLVFRKLKMKLYWSTIRPTVTYCCETWVLEETIETKLMVDVFLTVHHELTIY